MNKTSDRLTMRSKIRVYSTTNPADMGYDGRPTGGRAGAWKEGGYELCSVRRALAYNYELGQRVGQGTYRAVAYFHGKREIDVRELEELVIWTDMDRSLAPRR